MVKKISTTNQPKEVRILLLMVLTAIAVMTIIFDALSVMAQAQIKAVHHLTAAFLATVDFAKVVWRHFRALARKVRNLRKKR